MELVTGKREELEKRAAETLAAALNDAASRRKKVIFGIVGGSSVERIFRRLLQQKVNWKKIHIFMADERLVPISDKESNYNLAHMAFIESLLKAKLLPQKNVHPFMFDPRQEDAGLEEYENEFKKCGKKFDVLLLSAGKDCHIASLFPEHPALGEKGFFTLINDSPIPPKKRMTATLDMILKSGLAIMVLLGNEKSEAYAKLNDKYETIEACPAKAIKKIERSYLFTDIS